jgi:mono/diheme cytochrome c family protein
MFVTFALHFLFVLLTLGTALIGVLHLLRAWWGERPEELPRGQAVLHSFVAHKSLAVVLGVAPLLLVQVAYTLPFMNGVAMFAPQWLLVIVLLIAAFLFMDYLAHRAERGRWLGTLCAAAGLMCLLAVPGIFALVLVGSERHGQWPSMALGGFSLAGPLAWHWLLRVLHVLGAAAVLGGAYHYFFCAKEAGHRRQLLTWMVSGLLFQFLVGPLLALLSPQPLDAPALAFMSLGIVAAGTFLAWSRGPASREASLGLGPAAACLFVLLVAMLLTRQHLQDQSFLPLVAQAQQAAAAGAERSAPFQEAAFKEYQEHLERDYDQGQVLFAHACAFCHGPDGDGQGSMASSLLIAPAQLSAVRANREYLYRVIARGVPGSGMPYFTVFDRDKLERLLDHLGGTMGAIDPPSAYEVPPATLAKAREQYLWTCARCHGQDGGGNSLSVNFLPAPPDFRQLSLTPDKAFAVITNGYPGTVMQPFAALPEDVRRGLTQVLVDLRAKPGS